MALLDHLKQLFIKDKSDEMRTNRSVIIGFLLLPVVVCWVLAAYVMFFSE